MATSRGDSKKSPSGGMRRPNGEVHDLSRLLFVTQHLVRTLARLAPNPRRGIENLLPRRIVSDFVDNQNVLHINSANVWRWAAPGRAKLVFLLFEFEQDERGANDQNDPEKKNSPLHPVAQGSAEMESREKVWDCWSQSNQENADHDEGDELLAGGTHRHLWF